jgi:hypothetical protein
MVGCPKNTEARPLRPVTGCCLSSKTLSACLERSQSDSNVVELQLPYAVGAPPRPRARQQQPQPPCQGMPDKPPTLVEPDARQQSGKNHNTRAEPQHQDRATKRKAAPEHVGVAAGKQALAYGLQVTASPVQTHAVCGCADTTRGHNRNWNRRTHLGTPAQRPHAHTMPARTAQWSVPNSCIDHTRRSTKSMGRSNQRQHEPATVAQTDALPATVQIAVHAVGPPLPLVLPPPLLLSVCCCL